MAAPVVTPVIMAVLGVAGSAGVGAIVTAILLHKREAPKALAERAKTEAEAAKVKADAGETNASTALAIVQELRKDTDALRHRIENLEKDRGKYIDYIWSLRDHIDQGSPPPPPAWPHDIRP